MSYTLYGYWQSSCTWRVRIALNLKQINYSYIPINLLKGDQNADTYQKINKLEQVPTLVGPNFSLTQSLAIVQYLEDFHPEPSLIPSDPLLKAKMWEISEIINSGIQPLQNPATLNKIKNLGGNRKEWAQEVIRKGFTSIENLISHNSGRYCIGNSITIADACLIPQVNNAKRYGLDMQQFPIISKKLIELNKVPEIIKAAPENQKDASN